MVRYHSTIERDLLYFLEFWQTVTWYREQPMTIEHVMADGQVRRYTPDYEIHEDSTKSLVECKPTERLETPHAQQQRYIGKNWAEENGYRFITFTDTELRAGHQLANLKLLWRYARLRGSYPKQAILNDVRQERRSSVKTLSERLKIPVQTLIPIVCHLLFHHQLQMDLYQPFTIVTELEIGEPS
jgi:hypothetical protein